MHLNQNSGLWELQFSLCLSAELWVRNCRVLYASKIEALPVIQC